MNANIRMNNLEVLVHVNMFNLGPVHTIPDSLCIGLLFIPDRRSVHMAPQQSDTLCIVFAERLHSVWRLYENELDQFCARVNEQIRYSSLRKINIKDGRRHISESFPFDNDSIPFIVSFRVSFDKYDSYLIIFWLDPFPVLAFVKTCTRRQTS